VGNDQDIAITVGVFDFLQNGRGTTGDIDPPFPVGGSIPSGIRQPTHIEIMILTIDIVRVHSFPKTITDLL